MNDTGPIQPDSLYPLPVFSRVSGLGTAALRRAQKKGLRVCRVATRKFVLGRDFIAYAQGQRPAAGSAEHED